MPGHARSRLPPRKEVRLRILNALPQRHLDYCCAEISRMCVAYIGSLGISPAERDSLAMELLSEVMAKLLGVMSRRSDADAEPRTENDSGGREVPQDQAERDEEDEQASDESKVPIVWAVDDADPSRDGRVSWLIREVGGRQALAHRYEDMRRQRWGRWDKNGYRTVQPAELQSLGGADGDDDILSRLADTSHPQQVELEHPLHAADIKLAWQGLLAAAERQFSAGADVTFLLGVLAQDADVQAAFGTEWPIRQIVDVLNARHPKPPWSDDRVDNAKKRLKNWIWRLARENRFDTIDHLAFFARVAREKVAREGTIATETTKHVAKREGKSNHRGLGQ